MAQSELEGQEFEKLQNALLSAFPKHSDLKKMVKFELGENLGHITGSNNGLDHVVFELIEWAESKGKVEELVRGARKQNSGNAELKAFADEFFNSILDATKRIDVPLQLPRPVQYFTGRKEELQELLDAIQPGEVVTLCGPGGIGKSALAAKALWTLAPNNTPPTLFPDGIIYHDFYRHPQVTLALEEIVRAFGLELIEAPPQVAAKRVLAGRQVLLVLDGAEQADDLQAVLDVQNGCGVLIATRDRKQALGKRIDIHPLPSDEAVSLLSAWAKGQAADKNAVRKICELVGRLPLAVRLIGRYLTETDEYVEEYLEWLQNTPLEALHQGERQQESVPLLLEKSLTQVSHSAQKALAVVGMLAFAPFNQKVVAAVLGIESREARQLLGELIKYSLLVRRRNDRHYEVSHALIHTYARECLTVTDEHKERFINYYLKMTQEAVGEQSHFTNINNSYSHILKALQKIKERYGQEGDAACKQMIDFVEALDKYWQVHDQYQVQVRWLKEGYHCASLLGKRLWQARFAQRIGRAFAGLGKLEQALDWLKTAEHNLQGIEKIASDSLLGLICIHRASIIYTQGQLNHAQAECIRGLSLANQHDEQAAFAEGYNLLGTIYWRLGKYKEAIEVMEKSVKLWKALGNIYQVRRVESNIGMPYFGLGQLHKARKVYQSTQQYWQTFPNPSKEALMLNNLSVTSCTLGQCEAIAGFPKDSVIKHYQEAQNYGHQCLIISQKLNQKRLLILSLKALAHAQFFLGNLEEAKVHLNQSLEIQHESKIKIYLPYTYYILAKVTIDEKLYNQAITLAKKALMEIGAQGDLAKKGAANRVLGKAYRLSGELDKAQEYLKTSLSQLQAIKNPFETALTWRELALLYGQQGREQEAQEAEAEVQAILVQMGIIESEGESV